MIAIVDYGLGNVGSIANMLKKIGCSNIIFAKEEKDLEIAEKYILPGVGSFDTGMEMLNASGMREALDNQILVKKKPVLGICLGMQMLGESSEEGILPGLGYIPFKCKKFKFDDKDLRVPHMGWDYVESSKETPLTRNIMHDARFYFVHSYYAVCEDEKDVLLECEYGLKFAAAVNRGNIYGTQFHPEKSHSYGKWLIKNFVEEA